MATNKLEQKLVMDHKVVVGEGGGWESAGQISEIMGWLSNPNPEGKAFLGNAFSLQMVAEDAIINIDPCTPEDIPEDVVSCIGHADTANVVSTLLGRHIECARINVHLNPGDVIYVAQVIGGRLPEGATQLPEGVTITFRKVVVR